MAQRNVTATSGDGRTTAETIGRVGVWFGPSLAGAPAARAREVARRVEALGFGCLWIGESPGYREAFTHAALLDATRRLVVATGIANIWVRDPMAASAAAHGLVETFGPRFVLGLGASHAALVEPRGHGYGKPLTAMRGYLDALDTTHYRGAPPPRRPPRVLAALRGRMQDLARDGADGVHTFCVPPEHTARTRARIGERPLLAAEQAVVLADDAGAAREVARGYLGTRLALPNYRNNFLSLGFTEDDVHPPGSDALTDGLVAWRGVDDAVSRVGMHLEAGADHVAVHVLSGDGTGSPERSDLGHELDALERLAASLLPDR